jgi:hypothetical protein
MRKLQPLTGHYHAAAFSSGVLHKRQSSPCPDHELRHIPLLLKRRLGRQLLLLAIATMLLSAGVLNGLQVSTDLLLTSSIAGGDIERKLQLLTRYRRLLGLSTSDCSEREIS